jgi:hypothetical protein
VNDSLDQLTSFNFFNKSLIRPFHQLSDFQIFWQYFNKENTLKFLINGITTMDSNEKHIALSILIRFSSDPECASLIWNSSLLSNQTFRKVLFCKRSYHHSISK